MLSMVAVLPPNGLGAGPPSLDSGPPYSKRTEALLLPLAARYRFDIAAWEGFAVFRRLRELQCLDQCRFRKRPGEGGGSAGDLEPLEDVLKVFADGILGHVKMGTQQDEHCAVAFAEVRVRTTTVDE